MLEPRDGVAGTCRLGLDSLAELGRDSRDWILEQAETESIWQSYVGSLKLGVAESCGSGLRRFSSGLHS